jgi:hypothetical protein
MKVSVRRSGQNRIGVVTRVDREYVAVRWLSSDLGETAEYLAHRHDVTPLAGWLQPALQARGAMSCTRSGRATACRVTGTAGVE